MTGPWGIVLGSMAFVVVALAWVLGVVAGFARRFWNDREEMRVQAKAFIRLVQKAAEDDKNLSGWADYALEAWSRAKDEAVRWRGRKEPF